MRFFHIADVHLGAEPDKGCPWSQDRSREIWDSFQKAIEQAGKFHADLFLIAGDLFHRQPLVKDLKKVICISPFSRIENFLRHSIFP